MKSIQETIQLIAKQEIEIIDLKCKNIRKFEKKKVIKVIEAISESLREVVNDRFFVNDNWMLNTVDEILSFIKDNGEKEIEILPNTNIYSLTEWLGDTYRSNFVDFYFQQKQQNLSHANFNICNLLGEAQKSYKYMLWKKILEHIKARAINIL